MTLRERVEAGAEDDVLADSRGHLIAHQVVDEPGARHDRRTEACRAGEVHVRSVAPAGIGFRQAQTDAVRDHVRRRSASTCSARHSATRTAVPSGAVGSAVMSGLLAVDPRESR
jgi:hypothetical protein